MAANAATRAAARAADPGAAQRRFTALGEPAAFQSALVVVNPISGRGRGARAGGELAEGLRRLGIASRLHLTQGRQDAWSAVRTMGPDVDLVVAVGGDGTVREVLAGLVDPQIAVGILPMGTANVMAQELDLPRDVHAALEILARGRLSALDVADVNGQLSFLVTGVGLDGMAVRDVERRRHGPITKWSYVEAVARTLLEYEPPELRVELDGRQLDGTYGLVLVSNTVNYGGILSLDPASRIDDGFVEAYLFPRGTRLALLRGALTGFLSHLPGGACECFRVKRVRVEARGPVPYQTDGDFRGHVPVEIRVAPTQYRLVVP